ncbi:MAG: oligosaccharide flippase family protein [Rubrivivax sp.]|nr:oligosaccharide flippase family protein [Rubrivivax sp.]
MTDHLARRSAQALSWSWAGAGVRALLQFAVQVVLARLLGPDAWGQAAAALLVLGLASLVAEGGLAAALVQREALGPHDAGIAAGWVLLLSGATGAIVGLAAVPIATALGDPRLLPLVWAAAAIVPLQALSTLPPALLQRQLRAKRLQLVQLVAYAVAYGVVGIALAWAGAGAWSLLAAFALHAAIVAAGSMAAHARGERPSWRPRLAGGGMAGYGARTIAANVVNWALESVDRLFVSRLAGSAALGAYSVAATLARAPVTMLVSATQPVAFASAARLQGEHERIARGWLAMLSLALLVAVPLFGWLAMFSEPLVEWLYGSAWQAVVGPLSWLSMGVPFFVMLALSGPLLRGVDAVGDEMRAQLVVLALLALVLLGIADATVNAIAAWVAVASALRAASVSMLLSRRLGVPLGAPWRAWRGGLLLLGPVLVLAVACDSLIPGQGPAAIATALGSMVVAVVGMRIAARTLLGTELCLALLNRRGDSRLAGALCAWARLQPAVASPASGPGGRPPT